MSYPTPTLAALVARAQADTNSRLDGSEARLSVSTLKVVSYVRAGSASGLYGYVAWLSRQMFVDTCDVDMLPRHGNINKVPQKPATPSIGSVTMTSTGPFPVPAGTIWQRVDGAQFLTTADVQMAGVPASVPVVAVKAGTAGDTPAGTQLKLVSPLGGGMSNVATVDTAGITDGTDLEDPEVWRARIKDRIQRPISGGTKSDYEEWAKEVPGVTRAWCSPGEMGPGTITLRFVRDNDPGGLIPDAAAIAAVTAYINARRGVTSILYVVAPIAAPIDFQIQGLSPASDAVKLAVKTELADLLRREAIPGGTILRSHMNAAISAAAGEDDHVLVAPAGNVINLIGRISTVGVVTWL